MQNRPSKYSHKLKAIGSTGAILAITSGVSEAVIVNVSIDATVPVNNGYSFDATTSDFILGNNAAFDASLGTCSTNLVAIARTDFDWTTSTVSIGSSVDGSDSFSANSLDVLSIPGIGETEYLGYAFTSGADVFYGYAQYVGFASNQITIIGYAYETTANTAITVSDLTAVPEPSTTAAILSLAVGAFVVQRRSRRR